MQRRLTHMLVALVVLGLLPGLAGCGYRNVLTLGEGGRHRSQDGSLRPIRLAVMALENDSPEPWLDRILSDSLRREVDARAEFDLVDNPANADLVLRGRFRPLDIRSKSFSRFVSALEYAITMQLDLEVLRSSGDIIRLDEQMLEETEIYLASADIEVTRSNRLEALRRLADLLSGRVVDSIALIEMPADSTVGEAEG
jgi:hypothetical protein